MKSLYLMRHAQPIAGHPLDGTRALTDIGQKQAAQMAEWLRSEIGRVDIVITSPFTRASETAQVMADSLGAHTASTTLLQPDADPEAAWKEIERLAQAAPTVLVVGHDPSLNKLLFWLLGMTGDQTQIRFEQGSVAWLIVKASQAQLQWLVSPDLVPSQEEREVMESARELLDSLP